MIAFTEAAIARIADALGITDEELHDFESQWPNDLPERIEAKLADLRDAVEHAHARLAVATRPNLPPAIPEKSRASVQSWIGDPRGTPRLSLIGVGPASTALADLAADHVPVAPCFPVVELVRWRRVDGYCYRDQAVRADTDEVVATGPPLPCVRYGVRP